MRRHGDGVGVSQARDQVASLMAALAETHPGAYSFVPTVAMDEGIGLPAEQDA